MGGVMSPRIVLGRVAADGSPPLPSELGGVVVYSDRYDGAIGDAPAWEYRDAAAARLVVVQRVAFVTLVDGSPGALFVAWVPSDLRVGSNAVFDALAPALASTGVLVAFWPCDVTTDGSIRVSALEADASSAAALALSVWPASWRVRLPTDSPGDPMASPPVPPAPPSGPRCIGAVLA